jgi:hypothetical protein
MSGDPPFTLFRWVGSLMYIVVCTLLFGTFYVVMFRTLVPAFASSPVSTIVGGLFFSVAFVLAVASYVQVCRTHPGGVPANFLLRSDASSFRVCKDCNTPKPARSHHCEICGHCVLKQDHHCPWINVCVGFKNQKFFFQFLLYVVLLCIIGVSILVAKVDVAIFASTAADRDTLTPILQLVSLAIGVSLGLATLALLIMHAHLIASNLTGSEHAYGTSNPFHLGSRLANAESVLGPISLVGWMLPIYTTPGNGIDWPTKGGLQEV